MRGKLSDGMVTLAAAISHRTSKTTIIATPSQRVFQSARRGVDFAVASASTGCQGSRSLSYDLRRESFVGEELRQQLGAVVEI